MNIRQRPGLIRLSPGLLAVSIFGAGLLFAKIMSSTSPNTEVREGAPISISGASSRSVSDTSTIVAPPTVRTKIQVDATQSAPADVVALANIRTDVTRTLESWDTEGSAAGLDEAAHAGFDWNRWARLDASPAQLKWAETALPDKIDVYAVHSRTGATVCLSNRSTDDVNIDLRVRLAKAPYKLERLMFLPRREAEHAVVAQDLTGAPRRRSTGGRVRLARLMGRDMLSMGSTVVPVVLHVGETQLFRFTDSAYASRAALNEVRDQLRSLPRASAELSHRLHVILDGSGTFESAISANCGLSPDRRRASIHRFLLVLSQAYSLHRNFQVGNAVQMQPGLEFQTALERLNDSLADISATLMGLVPAISLLDPSQEKDKAVAAVVHTNGKQESDDAHVVYATVALSNQGSHSAELVKIGIDRTALPSFVRCDPSEPALFGTLAPGQTVRATYLLRWKGPAGLSDNQCIGDISYFTSGAPAHLRPRPW